MNKNDRDFSRHLLERHTGNYYECAKSSIVDLLTKADDRDLLLEELKRLVNWLDDEEPSLKYNINLKQSQDLINRIEGKDDESI